MADSRQDDTLLARWLAGDLSPAEEQELAQKPERADYERLLRATGRLVPPPYDAAGELARFRAARRAAKVKTLHPRSRKRLHWYAVAATLVLLLSTWFLWPRGDFYETGPSGTQLAELADGSTARLNAVSTLRFRQGKERRAKLTGEAYFDVVKSEVPFVVETDRGTVTVVGTSFNVYRRDRDLRVACTSGRVRVNFNEDEEDYFLNPGESVSVTAGNQANSGPTDEVETLDWLDGRTVFNDRPLAEVIAALERQFDLTFEIPPNLDLQREMESKFPNDDLETALDAVFSALKEVEYTREGKTVRLRLLPQ